MSRTTIATLALAATLTTVAAAQTPSPQHQQPAAKPAQTMAMTEKAATETQVRSAQEALIKAKLYHGKATGKTNPEFEAALKKYQTENKLKPTGWLDTETMARLKIR